MRIDAEQLKQECIGKWRGILFSLGIEIPDSPKTHGACPICGPGTNAHRFRFDDKDGVGGWICTQCGSGDGFALVRGAKGLTFPETLEMVNSISGSCEFVPEPKEQDETKKREAMNRIWQESGPLTGADVVTKYLRSRGIVIPVSQDVRLNPLCYESETKTKMPAMVALVRHYSGKPIGLHRTFLTDDFKKAYIKCPKKALGRTSQGAVRLMEYKDILGVAEGIETALAASQLFGVPVWSTIDSGVLESFVPPDEARKIIIFGDNDANFVGQSSAYRLAKRLYNKPFERIVEVQIPDFVGDDWADVLHEG